jgi:hypothetical protein
MILFYGILFWDETLGFVSFEEIYFWLWLFYSYFFCFDCFVNRIYKYFFLLSSLFYKIDIFLT